MSAVAPFKIGLLPSGLWDRIEHVFAQSDEPRPVPDLTKMLAVEKDGNIVATFASQQMINLSHLWIKEDMRGQSVAERLARQTINLYPKGTRAMMLTTNPHVEKLAFSIGMKPLAGSAWLWRGGG